MKITEILSADMVAAELGGTTKPQLLRELARGAEGAALTRAARVGLSRLDAARK